MKQIRKFMTLLGEGLLDLLYPESLYCAGCGDTIDERSVYGLCEQCMHQIHWTTEPISVQGSPKGDSVSYAFEAAYCCARYESRTKTMLGAFKYGKKPQMAKSMGRLMAERWKLQKLQESNETVTNNETVDKNETVTNNEAVDKNETMDKVDLVIPVPMHEKKQRRRGYNQAELLAASFAKHSLLPMRSDLLQRKKNTSVMNDLSPEERKANLESAFALRDGAEKEIQGKHILLIDDIYTTGTTAGACSRVLIEAGAAKVTVLVFASGAQTKEDVEKI